MQTDSIFRVGMILPSANVVAEREMPQLLPSRISLHTTRLRLTGSSIADLLAMQEDVESAARLLADAGVDLIAFHCTAVSTFSDELEESIIQRISLASGIHTVTAGRALVHELERCSAQKLVLVTPYLSEITDREISFLERRGVNVLASHSAGIASAADMSKFPGSHWVERVMAVQDPQADAYLLSCNGIWTNEARDVLQRQLGKPVITSNSALAAYCVAATAAFP